MLLSSAMRSVMWLFVFLLGIAAIIALVTGGFFALTQLEGLGSMLLLVGGIVSLRLLTAAPKKGKARLRDPEKSILTALAVLTFAFMGFALDQPGNSLYNAPLEWMFCPTGTNLLRKANVSNPRAGTTVITQDFSCQTNGQVVRRIEVYWVMLLRFLEYLILGYVLLGINALLERYFANRTKPI
jgi:hypothetical protein